ncbi:MAG TPA: O-antigen ligase family protein [Solirubrobacterales bacterium]|nr:O-antigen ligase family protein [Solirubrobacterales bacterium]
MIAPIALILGIALAGGGFDVTTRHVAGLAVWLVVVGMLVLGVASRASLAPPFHWAFGAIVCLALWSALSSFWSGSAELSVIEADRVLVYLGFFLAALLITQTDLRRQRFAEGVAIAVTIVALLGLASRLLPDVLQVANSLGSGPRLRYPLGYWNANGAMFGIAVGLLLWTSRRAAWTGMRWASVAAMPAVLLALYFTFSRGGVLALAVCAGCLIALSADRLWLLATLAIGAIGALPAVLAVQSRQALTDNIDAQAAVDQGLTVFLILLAGIGVALLLFAGLRRLESRQGARTGRVLDLSRNPVVLKRLALAGAVVALVGAVAIGSRASDEFSRADVQFPDDPAHRFVDLSSANRSDFWSVAVDSFADHPVDGLGAGSYEFAWEEQRSAEQAVHNAHSLYLEAFSELGLIGGVLVLVLVGTLLWTGFSAWRAARGRQRDLCAVLLAVMLAFAVGAALDWFWELAGLGAVFFLAAGAAVAARCRQLAPASGDEENDGRGFRLAVVGLAAAWLSAIALVGPLLVERELEASNNAAAEGEIANAIEHADTARSIEPWAASPYVQLGLLAELQGDYPAAAERFTQAIDREDRNWQLYYLRSRVERKAGDTAAAAADLRRARQLNPLEECLRGNPSCG